MNFEVENEIELLNFLNLKLNNKSKNSIKKLLINRNVLVNGKVQRKYNYVLKCNDKVEIIKKINKNIDIVFEDKNIIVVNKPSGLLTISTDKEAYKTLYRYVSDYEKMINKNSKIFIVHRLDKDTSGIVVFAKNREIKEKLQCDWNNLAIRKYIAVIEGNMVKKQNQIKTYIKENKMHKSFSSNNGDLAITNYKVLKENKNYSLIDIEIKTGKKNQIRLQLSELGNPIVGDKKYGSKVICDNMLLHAYSLNFTKKISNNNYNFKTAIPSYFDKFISINDIKNL